MKVCSWFLAFTFLPLSIAAAQQTVPQNPPPNSPHFQPPSPEVLRHMDEVRRRYRDHAIAINDAATHIQSPDDANKLVDLVVAEFSDEMPRKWASRSIRERVAHAEFKSATDPNSLIPEQRIADVWNDFVTKIGAPKETLLSAAEIHYVRDAQYVSAQLAWTSDEKQIWTIPGVFALGPDGKIAKGARALEAIRLLWNLANTGDDFAGTHKQVEKGVLLSDLFPHPDKPPLPSQQQSGMAIGRIASIPVQQAAFQYTRDHGARAYDRHIEDLLKQLLAN